MGMSFWYIFTSVRMLLVLYSLFFFFSLVIFQGIWPRCFSLVIFIWNDTHIFLSEPSILIVSQQFQCGARSWKEILVGWHWRFVWPCKLLPLSELILASCSPWLLEWSQTGPLCFPVSFCCLFSISPVLKSTDTPFLFSATSVQSCTHWGLGALVSTLSLEIQGIYRCYISCP